MLPDDVFRSRLQSTITALRYWAPSVADTARLEETETSDYWKIIVAPAVASACPFELTCTLISATTSPSRTRPTKAGRSKRSTGSCRSPRPSLRGNVVQRRWISRLTGLERSVETVVTLAGGGIWREVRGCRPACRRSTTTAPSCASAASCPTGVSPRYARPCRQAGQALHGGDLGAELGDALDGFRQGLGRHLHVVGVGVHQRDAVGHDADVALPVDEIAALHALEHVRDGDVLAELGLLHVGIAGRRDAGRLERYLDETRAVDAETRAPAPQ